MGVNPLSLYSVLLKKKISKDFSGAVACKQSKQKYRILFILWRWKEKLIMNGRWYLVKITIPVIYNAIRRYFINDEAPQLLLQYVKGELIQMVTKQSD